MKILRLVPHTVNYSDSELCSAFLILRGIRMEQLGNINMEKELLDYLFFSCGCTGMKNDQV